MSFAHLDRYGVGLGRLAGACQPVQWRGVDMRLDADGGATISAPVGAVRVLPGTRGWIGPTQAAYARAWGPEGSGRLGLAQGTYQGDGVLRPDQSGAVWLLIDGHPGISSIVPPECPPEQTQWIGEAPREGQAPIHEGERRVEGLPYSEGLLLTGPHVPGISAHWDTGRMVAFWGPVAPREDRYSSGVIDVRGWVPLDKPARWPPVPQTTEEELAEIERVIPGTAGGGVITEEQAAAVPPTETPDEFIVATGTIDTVIPVDYDDEGLIIDQRPPGSESIDPFSGPSRTPEIDVPESEGLVTVGPGSPGGQPGFTPPPGSTNTSTTIERTTTERLPDWVLPATALGLFVVLWPRRRT